MRPPCVSVSHGQCEITHLYSLPLCKATLRYFPDSKKISLSTNPDTSDKYLTMLERINSLTMILPADIVADIEQKVCCLLHNRYELVENNSISIILCF